ncbi:ESX secretion-associated protein EspG [Amycolatopsis pigmentata]|uniref:ESX secretion-associated protein EspG n=1 Tax=Amycolatopsis pigmentata TaxID=450801 RepID=A0ABW5G6P0_9PSEU
MTEAPTLPGVEAVGNQAGVAVRARVEMPSPVDFDPVRTIRDAASSGNLLDLIELSDVLSARRDEAGIREALYRDLAERGLSTEGGPDPSLMAGLTTLSEADVYVECEGLPDLARDGEVRAVAAAGGRRAVLVGHPGETLGLSGIRETEIWTAVVGLVPPLEPGPGHGVTLPASALRALAEAPAYGLGNGTSAYGGQIREVMAIQARPVLGAGQFSVRVRENGRLRRTGGVSWFVTDAGSYLGSVGAGRGREDWVSVSPADPQRLVKRLAGFLE